MAPEGAGLRDDSAIVCSHVSGSPAPETKIIKSSSQRAVMVPGLSWFQGCHGSRVQGCHGYRVVGSISEQDSVWQFESYFT